MNKLVSSALTLATLATLGGSAAAATTCPNLTPDATKTLRWDAVKHSFLGQDFGAGVMAILGVTVDCQHASADVNGVVFVKLAGVELRAFDVHPQLAVDSADRVTASVSFVTFGHVIDTLTPISSSPNPLDYSGTYSASPIPANLASKSFSAMKSYNLPIVGTVALMTSASYQVSAQGYAFVGVQAHGPEMSIDMIASVDVGGSAHASASGTVAGYSIGGSGNASLDIIHLPYVGFIARLGGQAAGYIAEMSFMPVFRQHLLEADLSAHFSLKLNNNEVASKDVSVFHMDDQWNDIPSLDFSYSKNLGSAAPF